MKSAGICGSYGLFLQWQNLLMLCAEVVTENRVTPAVWPTQVAPANCNTLFLATSKCRSFACLEGAKPKPVSCWALNAWRSWSSSNLPFPVRGTPRVPGECPPPHPLLLGAMSSADLGCGVMQGKRSCLLSLFFSYCQVFRSTVLLKLPKWTPVLSRAGGAHGRLPSCGSLWEESLGLLLPRLGKLWGLFESKRKNTLNVELKE